MSFSYTKINFGVIFFNFAQCRDHIGKVHALVTTISQGLLVEII